MDIQWILKDGYEDSVCTGILRLCDGLPEIVNGECRRYENLNFECCRMYKNFPEKSKFITFTSKFYSNMSLEDLQRIV